MKKILTVILGLAAITSLYAANTEVARLTLTGQGGVENSYITLRVDPTVTTAQTGAFFQNTDLDGNVNLYISNNTEKYSSYKKDNLTNLPLEVITNRRAAANQHYTITFNVPTSTVGLKLKDLKTGDNVDIVNNGTYEFDVNTTLHSDYVEGTNYVVKDRFVINYNYVNLKGDFDNPNGGGAWIWLNDFVEHGETATKEYTLPADAWCHFQVIENGVDYADSFDFDESNKSHQFTTPGWSEELTLHTAEAGVYTFTWNYVTNTLTIDFPAPAPSCATVRDNLQADRYYTICLPQEVVSANGASFWNLSKRGEGVAYLEEAELPLEAGRPYIFQAEAEELCVVYGNAVPAASAGAEGALVGTFAAMNQSALDAAATTASSDIYLLYDNKLWLANSQSGNNLPAYRAYIVYKELIPENPTPAPGRRVRAIPMANNAPTGFESIKATEAPTKMIIDGKMYILRGEQMFDATGRIVK